MKISCVLPALLCGLHVAGEIGYSQTNLECIGHVNDYQWGAFDVAVSGRYAFLANGGDGLRIYDVSDPASPICVGHTDDGGALGLALCGDYAYVACSTDGMRIYDVSNPAHPICVGHSPQMASASSFGVVVSGFREQASKGLFGKAKHGAQYAYLANYNDGLRIYDVSNPTRPIHLAHVNDGGIARHAAVEGEYLYLANGFDGLRVYRISNPSNPAGVAHVKDTGFPWGVAVEGNYAYIAEGFYGFSIFDVSDPTHPVGVGHANNSPPVGTSAEARAPGHVDGRAAGIAVSGHLAYVANFGDGVRVYDVSNPNNPVNIAHTTTNYQGFSKRVAVANGLAFVANANDGLRIYRVWAGNSNVPARERPWPAAMGLAMSLVLIVIAWMVWTLRARSRARTPSNTS